ncbi:syntaxin 18, isoform CRA_d [Rattus norvegicus]|uniref:Syntaxin 18, isoform CRA_d n=1 Tax=Rattus norvegicus TaxID=10116 RepID=A6IJU9_RAT|nr:syntaxin 18, isoform CRA_d [Rattus norvegicus]
MTASPPGPGLHHCPGQTTCQRVPHLLWGCVRPKGWESMAPKPTCAPQDLEIHGLPVPCMLFRVQDKGSQELHCQDRPHAWWRLSNARIQHASCPHLLPFPHQ